MAFRSPRRRQVLTGFGLPITLRQAQELEPDIPQAARYGYHEGLFRGMGRRKTRSSASDQITDIGVSRYLHLNRAIDLNPVQFERFGFWSRVPHL